MGLNVNGILMAFMQCIISQLKVRNNGSPKSNPTKTYWHSISEGIIISALDMCAMEQSLYFVLYNTMVLNDCTFCNRIYVFMYNSICFRRNYLLLKSICFRSENNLNNIIIYSIVCFFVILLFQYYLLFGFVVSFIDYAFCCYFYAMVVSGRKSNELKQLFDERNLIPLVLSHIWSSKLTNKSDELYKFFLLHSTNFEIMESFYAHSDLR